MRCITAIYKVTDAFHIPDDLPLLSIEENEKQLSMSHRPWSWYIKWGVLYYFDEDLKQHDIQPCSVGDCDKKYPRDVDDEKEEEDSSECIYYSMGCPARLNSPSAVCNRCGRNGHMMDACCEKKNIYGDYID
jgi:hypothetical protein